MTTRPVHGAPRVTTGPVMLDPGNFTPYYIDGLCGAFHRLGVDIRVISAPPLFEPVDPGVSIRSSTASSPSWAAASAGCSVTAPDCDKW